MKENDWHKKQIAVIGEAVKMVARQRGERVMGIIFDVIQYVDPDGDERAKEHGGERR